MQREEENEAFRQKEQIKVDIKRADELSEIAKEFFDHMEANEVMIPEALTISSLIAATCLRAMKDMGGEFEAHTEAFEYLQSTQEIIDDMFKMKTKDVFNES